MPRRGEAGRAAAAPRGIFGHDRSSDPAGGGARRPPRRHPAHERPRRERADGRRSKRPTSRCPAPGLPGSAPATTPRKAWIWRASSSSPASSTPTSTSSPASPRRRSSRGAVVPRGHDDGRLRSPRDRERARARGDPLHARGERRAPAHNLRDGELMRAGDPHGDSRSRARRGRARLARRPARAGSRRGHELPRRHPRRPRGPREARRVPRTRDRRPCARRRRQGAERLRRIRSPLGPRVHHGGRGRGKARPRALGLLPRSHERQEPPRAPPGALGGLPAPGRALHRRPPPRRPPGTGAASTTCSGCSSPKASTRSRPSGSPP